jgi:ABC-2 type transport system permease protein
MTGIALTRPLLFGDLARTLRKSGAMFRRDASLALSYDYLFWGNWIALGIQVLSFYFISKLIPDSPKYGFQHHAASYFQFIAINLAFVRFQATAIQCFQTAIRDDQLAGTLEAIMATPTSIPVIILSRGLWAFTLTMLQVAVFLLLAAGLGLNLGHANLGSTVLFILLTVACMSPLGVMAAASIMTFKQGAASTFLMGGLTQLFGGVFFPVSTLPPALQVISWLMPITHSLQGIRGAVHGASIAQLAPEAIWLTIASVILLPISLWLFARAVHVAKVDGTLGHY